MITNKDISIDSENGKITLNGNKYDLGTQGEIDTAVKGVYSVMGQMGAKNLLVPEWTETQTTENGVTYTFNVDGTIIMNTDASGATADTNCNLKKVQTSTDNIYPAGTYKLSGCPYGGSGTTYRTWTRAYRPGDTSSPLTTNLYDEGDGVTFTVNETFQLAINLTVMKDYVCNNLTWKPMLCLASDTDNTYQPYAKTNKQLTDQLATKQDTLTFDDAPTASSTNPVTSAGIKTYVDTAIDGTTYKAGDTITAENVVSAAIGSNTSDCYFSVPISKPVAASAVAVSDVSCNLYYGTNQMEAVTEGAYTATIEGGSLLVKLTKANTFSQYGRYIVDFTGTFTFS